MRLGEAAKLSLLALGARGEIEGPADRDRVMLDQRRGVGADQVTAGQAVDVAEDEELFAGRAGEIVARPGQRRLLATDADPPRGKLEVRGKGPMGVIPSHPGDEQLERL